MRDLKDVRAWLSQPKTGSAETAVAPWWRLLVEYAPDIRIVVVRRPVDQVVDSMLAVDMQGSFTFSRDGLERMARKLDAKLDQIERRCRNVLSVRFEDLHHEMTCAAVFEHCLPYRFDPVWRRSLARQSLQCSMPAIMRYAQAFKPQLDKLAAMAKQASLQALSKRPIVETDGMTIKREPFDIFYRDSQGLFAEHLVEVGEHPEAFSEKNLPLMRMLDQIGALQVMVATSNGRVFGYLMSVLSPSLERPDTVSAVHTTFFASKDFPGLGLKLQRAALENLRSCAVDEVFMRAGPRGSGPKMGALYRRMGAMPDGEMYRLTLREV